MKTKFGINTASERSSIETTRCGQVELIATKWDEGYDCEGNYHSNEVQITDYINKADAEKIIAHLKEAFDL